MRLNKIMNIKLLQAKAKKLRKDTFQAFIKKKEAHLGGSFSMIEIFNSVLRGENSEHYCVAMLT